RQAACAALGQMGSAAAEAIPVLMNALADSQPDVCRAAIDALAHIGPAARPALWRMIHDRAEAVGPAKDEALRQVPELAVPTFFRELDRWDKIGRENAVRVMLRIEAEHGSPDPATVDLGLGEQDQTDRLYEAAGSALAEIASQV